MKTLNKIQIKLFLTLLFITLGFYSCKMYKSDYCIPNYIKLDEVVDCSCGQSTKVCFMDFRIRYTEEGALQTIRLISKDCKLYIYQTIGTKIVEIYKQMPSGCLTCIVQDSTLLENDIGKNNHIYIQLIRENIKLKSMNYLLLNNKKIKGNYYFEPYSNNNSKLGHG